MRAIVALPAATRSVAQARTFVRMVLGPDEHRVDDVELLTSELVTNAIRHAESAVILRVAAGPRIRVEVHDSRPPTGVVQERLDDPPAVPSTDPGGRGLLLVNALARRFGVEAGADGGKVVWFEL